MLARSQDCFAVKSTNSYVRSVGECHSALKNVVNVVQLNQGPLSSRNLRRRSKLYILGIITFPKKSTEGPHFLTKSSGLSFNPGHSERKSCEQSEPHCRRILLFRFFVSIKT